MMHKLILRLLIAGVFATAAWGQKAASNFVIDKNKPYVYIAFDHDGKLLRGASPAHFWLRLVNNCRIPIEVRSFGFDGPDAGPGLNYEVVPSSDGTANDGALNEPQLKRIPRGFSFHVGSLAVIEPGDFLVFRVPREHVGKKWHLEVKFDLVLSTPKSGIEPRSVVGFFWDDLPVVHKK